MRLVTVLEDGQRRAGVLADGEVLVTALPGGLDAAIAQGLDPSELPHRGQRRMAPEEAVLDAPLRPPVVFCTGRTTPITWTRRRRSRSTSRSSS